MIRLVFLEPADATWWRYAAEAGARNLAADPRWTGHPIPQALQTLASAAASVSECHQSSPLDGPPEPWDVPLVAVTIDQAARMLQVSKSTARRLIDDGSLPTVELGPGTVRVRVTDLQALLDQRTRPCP